jgi:serine-threonine kinase receptor-associated protein
MTPDGFFLISAAKDNQPMIRNGQTGDWIGTLQGHKGAIWGAVLDSNAERAATASADYTAKLWNALTGDEVHTFDHPKVVRAVDFAPSGERLVTACNDKTVRVFDLQNYASAPQQLTGHTGEIKKVLWADKNGTVISGGDDKIIRVWDARTLKESHTIPVSGHITSLELSRDGSVLTVAFASQIDFYQFPSMTLIKSVTAPGGVNSASLHPDKTTFVWGGVDFAVHVVDYETLQQQEEYKGHFGPIHAIRYSPDGEVYASGSEDGTIRLWQAHVGKEYGLWKFSTKADQIEATAAVVAAVAQ